MDLSGFTKYLSGNKGIVESSLLLFALEKVLTGVERSDLVPYVKSIKHSGSTVTITTSKPVVNTELRQYESEFIDAFGEELGKKDLRLRFL